LGARNIETGVEVSGRPAMIPPTLGPHRRTNSIAAATRAGVSRIFRSIPRWRSQAGCTGWRAHQHVTRQAAGSQH